MVHEQAIAPEMKVEHVSKHKALPVMITGPADVNRVLLELRQLSEYMEQESLRKTSELKLPKTTASLDELSRANKASLLDAEDREHLQKFLVSLQQHAPVLHISFASEPSQEFTTKIVQWLRSNVSRYVLVQIGLQPSIAGGCVVRSTNKIFDFSLRRHMAQSRDKMIAILHDVRECEEAAT